MRGSMSAFEVSAKYLREVAYACAWADKKLKVI